MRRAVYDKRRALRDHAEGDPDARHAPGAQVFYGQQDSA